VKAIVFDEIGSPDRVLYLGDVPRPQIKDGEALIRMLAAPISPGDFLFIGNLYPEPKKPQFPRQIGGNHGVGLVEQVGRDVSLEPGTLVAFSYYNSWAEYAAIPAQWLLPLPGTFPVDKAAQFFNLITAWDLVEGSGVGPDQWLVVTAGYAAVSTMVLQFARRRGVKTIAIVRQEHEHLDLRSLGTSHVIDLSSTSGSVGAHIAQITHNQGIRAVIDNVGGPVTGELIRSMAVGGQVIINGAMSPERFELHNFDVLPRALEIRAHIYRYFFNAPTSRDRETLAEIVKTAQPDDFVVPTGGMHPLEDFQAAIEQTIRNPGRGKRLFKM